MWRVAAGLAWVLAGAANVIPGSGPGQAPAFSVKGEGERAASRASCQSMESCGRHASRSAGAVRALREGRGDDVRYGARAAFEQIGLAGRAGSDAEALRHEGRCCESEGLDRWVSAGGGVECGKDGGGNRRGIACSLGRGTGR